MPTSLWGKSGHFQTGVYAKVGRFNSPYPKGTRKHMVMPDGATVSYDTFEPTKKHPSGGKYSSKDKQGMGFRCLKGEKFPHLKKKKIKF